MNAGDTPEEPRGHIAGAGTRAPAAHRIAFGTLARSTGEVIGKVASLAFFVVVARELGEEQFGDFVFGMSLSTVLLIAAGLGMQELIGREVAKDPARADDLFWNVVVLKGLMMVGLLAVIGAVVAIQGYSAESAAAIMIVSVGIGFEYQAASFYSIFDGRERQQYVATALIVNRISTAVLGITVALAGAGLVTVAIVFTLGSALGVATAYVLMRRFVMRPAHHVQPRAWGALIRESLPLGILSLLGTVSFRSSVVLLGLLSATSADVGEYGAAYRLVEATLFLPAAFNAAVLPWFSRQAGGPVSLARGFGMAIKTVITLVLPVGLGLALFAEPLIETLYGAEYEGAVAPLRLLGAIVVAWGINTTIVIVLISRNRPDVYTRPAIVTATVGLALSILLIPPHGAIGAAIAAVGSTGLLVAVMVPRVGRLFGEIRWASMLVAPVLAGAVMALLASLLGGAPWAVAALISVAGYGVAFLALERSFFPDDFAFYRALSRIRPGGRRLAARSAAELTDS